ncbi:MAG: hypothetical protein NNA31_07165 [Nitrospira sp.]|nr:hypothetical protein [Nitrospira sp.]
MKTKKTGHDSFGDPVVPDRKFAAPIYQFIPLGYEATLKWFESLHEMNKYLRTPEGAWYPQPFTSYAKRGISIENIALISMGYMNAHTATKKLDYWTRAIGGVEYLLKKRMFGDGHLLLQGHTVIDITYTFAGLALLRVWEICGETRFLVAAKKLGDHLVAYHISGSTNHACTPAQLLASLYKITGDEMYLDCAVQRISSSAIPYQLPYGGWPYPHESWSWYHSLITKSIIQTYLAMPYILKYQSKKDKFARAIYKAINRLIVSQRADGGIKPGRGKLRYLERDEYGCSPSEEWAFFDPSVGFARAMTVPSHEFYCYELDLLCTAALDLHANEFSDVIHGVAQKLSNEKTIWRPEFNTMAAGAYLQFLCQHLAGHLQSS